MEPKEKEEGTVDRKNRAQRADQYGLKAWRFSSDRHGQIHANFYSNNQVDSREAIPAAVGGLRHGCWPLQTNRDGTSVPSAICLATAWLDFGSVRHTWSTLLGPSNFLLINQFSELYHKKRPHSKETAAMWHIQSVAQLCAKHKQEWKQLQLQSLSRSKCQLESF